MGMKTNTWLLNKTKQKQKQKKNLVIVIYWANQCHGKSNGTPETDWDDILGIAVWNGMIYTSIVWFIPYSRWFHFDF